MGDTFGSLCANPSVLWNVLAKPIICDNVFLAL